MSISRRLGRIFRSHVNDWLNDDSEGDPWAAEGSWEEVMDDVPDADSSEEAGPRPTGPDGQPVPDDVAKAYRALEVPVGSDRRTVKKGFRRVMKKYHQDRFDEDPDRRDIAGEVSKRLNLAYERVMEYLEDS